MNEIISTRHKTPEKTTVKHAITMAVYDRNVDAWRSPARGSGSPTLLSWRQNLQGMIGDGGTLWVVLSRNRPGKSRLYSLTYKLVECTRFTAHGQPAEAFGPYGVHGNPAASSFFPSNDAQFALMSLRFPSVSAIPSLKKIYKHLRFPRYLSQEDVYLLEEYAERHIDRRSVFVCYSHMDAHFAIQLKDALESQGISVFRDEESILSGEAWRQGISHAIENAMYFLVLCSPESAQSKEVHEEIGQALDRISRAKGTDFAIVPILLEGASLEDETWVKLANFQARWWNQEYPEAMFDKLAEDFKHARFSEAGRLF